MARAVILLKQLIASSKKVSIIDVIGVGPDRSTASLNEELLIQVASITNGHSHYRFIKDSQTLTSYTVALSRTLGS